MLRFGIQNCRVSCLSSNRTTFPLLRLCLLLALVSGLKRHHAGLAHFGVPGVKAVQTFGVNRGRKAQLLLLGAPALAVAGAHHDR